MEQEIEFTIKADTNEVQIETFGIKGKECSKLVEQAQIAIGGTVSKDDKKPEFWQDGQDVHIMNFK